MLGVLLESRARRQRRTGGAVLSAASHLAIAGVVTAFTARGPGRPVGPEKPVVVHVVYPTRPMPTSPATSTAHASVSTSSFVSPRVRQIDVPTITPVGIPVIRATSGVSLDSLLIGGAHVGPPSRGGGLLADEPESGGGEWRGNDLIMRIVEQSKPRYPEPLRQAGISGRVLVRFTVDTLGRVDPATMTVVQSTHEMFANSARVALAGFRFRPAEVNGHRVPALAEMPFEFVSVNGKR